MLNIIQLRSSLIRQQDKIFISTLTESLCAWLGFYVQKREMRLTFRITHLFMGRDFNYRRKLQTEICSRKLHSFLGPFATSLRWWLTVRRNPRQCHRWLAGSCIDTVVRKTKVRAIYLFRLWRERKEENSPAEGNEIYIVTYKKLVNFIRHGDRLKQQTKINKIGRWSIFGL